ncbi:MAG: exopolyphosphatase, partial [Myxococcota bacterium]|nr:exopolyphosphatase [Myxococcota bacterium]
YEQGCAAWNLPRETGRKLLSWAARLHEIGLSFSHAGYHRHGAYILLNSDLPGFSRDDKELLAAVVLGHRRKLTPQRLQTVLDHRRVPNALRLTVFLRLARRLHRNRSSREMPDLSVTIDDDHLTLAIADAWLEEHPLTRADLEDEAYILRAAGLDLTVTSLPLC